MKTDAAVICLQGDRGEPGENVSFKPSVSVLVYREQFHVTTLLLRF